MLAAACMGAALLAALCVPAALAQHEEGHQAGQAADHGTMDHGTMDMAVPQDGAAPMAGPMDGHDAAGHDAAGHEMSGEEVVGKTHDHEGMMREAEKTGVKVGVEEHLGRFLPLDTAFTDSEGRRVTLGEALTGPTMILPVYFTCPNVCHILQGAMARVLPEVALEPGTELNILSISFDEYDTPEVAARNKRNFAAALRGGFDPAHWRFLTGDKAAIDEAMDALGFRFERMDKDFAHPVVVIAVSPQGKIVRYLYGSDFLPFDVTMAATEAAKGTPGISVKRLLSFCYSYDPQGRRYAFDILRVSGITVLVSLGLILVVLLTAGKKKKRRGGGS